MLRHVVIYLDRFGPRTHTAREYPQRQQRINERRKDLLKVARGLIVAIVVPLGRRIQWELETLATPDGGILVATHPRFPALLFAGSRSISVLLHAALLASYLPPRRSFLIFWFNHSALAR